MAVVYVPDGLVARVLATGKDKCLFVKQAIEEKLKSECAVSFKKNGVQIGATSPTTYVVQDADVGKSITFSVEPGVEPEE